MTCKKRAQKWDQVDFRLMFGPEKQRDLSVLQINEIYAFVFSKYFQAGTCETGNRNVKEEVTKNCTGHQTAGACELNVAWTVLGVFTIILLMREPVKQLFADNNSLQTTTATTDSWPVYETWNWLFQFTPRPGGCNGDRCVEKTEKCQIEMP